MSGPSATIVASSSSASRVANASSLSPGLPKRQMIRAADVAHERQRQIEIAMEIGQAGQAARDDRDAVIGLLARR